MKSIKFLILLFSIGLIVSCSGDSESSGTITLASNFTTRYVGEAATLTVTSSSDEDVTSSSTFYANGEEIASNVFTATAEGTYTITAKKNGKTSNAVVITVTPSPVPVTSLTLSSNKTSVATGENILYLVYGNNGANLSPQSTIYFNGVAQTGFNLNMNTAGTIAVHATYLNINNQTITSNTIQITVINAINFNKRVLIEDFTGTWCGWCPRVSYGIEQVRTQTNDAEVVAIHKTSGSGFDPYNISTPGYAVSGYPTAKLNRTTDWEYPEPETVSQVVGLTTGTNPRLGLAVNPSLNGSTLNIDVNVKFGFNFTGTKLVVYVLESGLTYNQTNYTSYYNGASTIANFTHNHVLRSVVTDIMGDAITGSTNSGDVFNRTFSIPVPSNISNTNNMSVVAFVVDANGKAINVRTANIGATQSFEQE